MNSKAPDADWVQEIKYKGCFTIDEPAIPGFSRFFSADPRFPVSICHPKDMGFFYDFNNVKRLHVNFGDSDLIIACEDLRLQAENGDNDALKVVRGERDAAWLMQQGMEMRKRGSSNPKERYIYDTKDYHFDKKDTVSISSHNVQVSRLWWTTFSGLQGQWVFFMTPALKLWTIRYPPDPSIDSNIFTLIILPSFELLHSEFFHQLPAQFKSGSNK